MPCGSTTCNSTNTIGAVSPIFPDLGWSWKIPLAWLAGMARRWERRSRYRELLGLDDRILADIGISRTAAEEARRSRLYMMAWRDSG